MDEVVVVDMFQAIGALFQLGRESGGKGSGIWATYQLDRISLVIIPKYSGMPGRDIHFHITVSRHKRGESQG